MQKRGLESLITFVTNGGVSRTTRRENCACLLITSWILNASLLQNFISYSTAVCLLQKLAFQGDAVLCNCTCTARLNRENTSKDLDFAPFPLSSGMQRRHIHYNNLYTATGLLKEHTTVFTSPECAHRRTVRMVEQSKVFPDVKELEYRAAM